MITMTFCTCADELTTVTVTADTDVECAVQAARKLLKLGKNAQAWRSDRNRTIWKVGVRDRTGVVMLISRIREC